MKWSKEDEIKSIELIKNGKTYEEISSVLNRTKKSIKEKLNELGHSYSMYNKVEKIDKECASCKKIFSVSKNDKQQMSYIYCSHSCATTETNKKRKTIKYCLNCGQKIDAYGTKQKYCNHICQKEYQYKKYIERWKDGKENGRSGKLGTSKHLRRYLFEKYNSKCSKCGWSEKNQYTGNIPLNIEHIDGNWMNNKEENLDLLCPNCHSLTPTYGGLNKGNGRKDRKKVIIV